MLLSTGALILLCAYVQEQNGAATIQQSRPLRRQEIMNMVTLGLEILLEEGENTTTTKLSLDDLGGNS